MFSNYLVGNGTYKTNIMDQYATYGYRLQHETYLNVFLLVQRVTGFGIRDAGFGIWYGDCKYKHSKISIS